MDTQNPFQEKQTRRLIKRSERCLQSSINEYEHRVDTVLFTEGKSAL